VARWPDGLVCPHCDGGEHSRFLADRRRYWQCSHCRKKTTLRAGTLLHDSKVALTLWFQAMSLVTQYKNNLSALSLKHHLGVVYAGLQRTCGDQQVVTTDGRAG
jgi:transposase-like protein